MHGRGAAPLALRSTTAAGRRAFIHISSTRSSTTSSSSRTMAAPTPLPPLGPAPTPTPGAPPPHQPSNNPLPAFLRLIAAVNKGVGAVEREGLVPLVLEQQGVADAATIGHVRPSFMPTLLSADAPSAGGGGALVPVAPPDGASSSSPPSRLLIHPRLATAAQRTEAMAKTAAVLRDRGVVTGWRGEPYPIFGERAAWTAAPGGALFEVERAAVPWLGARAFGVHINGYVTAEVVEEGEVRGGMVEAQGGGGPEARAPLASPSSSRRRLSRSRPSALWVARRSKNKPTWPGMLDHLAAGGQPAGMGATANAVKEAWEEAGVPGDLCEGGGLRPVGAVTYRGLSSEGLKPDTLFVYDLELPLDFVPEPQDGEVETFELWTVERVVEALAEAGAALLAAAGSGGGGGGSAGAPAPPPLYPSFKPNVAVVMIDFLVRHGFVGPDTGPEYAEVVAKLRQ